MHILHVINSDRQTRLLNVFGQIAMFWEIKKKRTRNGVGLLRIDSNRCP